MRTAKQLSVSLVNKPGRLADVLGALAKGKVNFLALSVMDSKDRGTVRFVPDGFDAAAEVLEKLNIRFDATDVVAGFPEWDRRAETGRTRTGKPSS